MCWEGWGVLKWVGRRHEQVVNMHGGNEVDGNYAVDMQTSAEL